MLADRWAGNDGDAVHAGGFQFQRAYPGVDPGWAIFGTLICSHLAGTKFYKLDSKSCGRRTRLLTEPRR